MSYRRNPDRIIGERIADVIRDNGSTNTVVAAAADMRPAEFEAALQGQRSFEFEQLVRVGGFLRVRVPDLFEGVTT